MFVPAYVTDTQTLDTVHLVVTLAQSVTRTLKLMRSKTTKNPIRNPMTQPKGTRLQLHLISLPDGTPYARIILQDGENPDMWLDVLANADECVHIGTTLIKAAKQLREINPPGGPNNGKPSV